MPKEIEFEGQVHEFPDDFTDADIQKALAQIKPKAAPVQQTAAPKTWSDKLLGDEQGNREGGFLRSVVDTAVRPNVDLIEGAVSGAASTIYHGGDLIRRGLGMERIINKPEVQQAMTAPPTTAGQVGRVAEQAAEFLVPTATVGKVAKGVEAATAGVRGARVLNAGARAALEGASAAGVTTAQTGDVEEGKKAGVMGGAVSGGAQVVARGVKAATPIVRNRLNPVLQASMDWAEKHGIPLSVGQRSGNRMVVRMERGLENTFGSSGRAQQFFQNQEQKLEQAGRGIVSTNQPGVAMNEYEAGQNLANRIKSTISDAKTNADTVYADIRLDYAKNAKTVQTGTRPIVGSNGKPMVDAQGKPLVAPVTHTFELPVDVTGAKAQLAPLFEELKKTMPEAKRQMSPGFQALKEIVEGPDIMDAVTADRNLGALKALVRGGNNPYLNSRSQGLAKFAIKKIESDFDGALNAADPAIMPKLQQARALVRKQHTVAEILNDLPDDPAVLYKRMVSAGDRTYNDLAFLNSHAPQEMRQIGRTFLDGLFAKATKEGGFQRAAGVMRDWQALGPKTKLLMFGNQQSVNELDKFFLAAKQLTKDENASGTTKMLLATFGVLGIGYDVATTPGGPTEKVKRAARDLTVAPALTNATSRILLSPGGAKLLTTALTRPPSSPAFRQALNGVLSLMTREEREQFEQANPEVASSAKTYTVTDPRGVVHTFTSPGSAEAFKKAIGQK